MKKLKIFLILILLIVVGAMPHSFAASHQHTYGYPLHCSTCGYYYGYGVCGICGQSDTRAHSDHWNHGKCQARYTCSTCGQLAFCCCGADYHTCIPPHTHSYVYYCCANGYMCSCGQRDHYTCHIHSYNTYCCYNGYKCSCGQKDHSYCHITHSGGTHSNGGACTTCETIYQTHGQNSSVSHYDQTVQTHRPNYNCVYPGCTTIYTGTYSNHTWNTTTHKCTVCGYGETTPPVIAMNGTATPTYASSGMNVTIPLKITEKESGLVTTTFDKNDILVKVADSEITSVTKTLTYKSVSNGIYSYELVLKGLTSNGALSIEFANGSVEDVAGNTNQEVAINNLGVEIDNTKPIVRVTDTDPQYAKSAVKVELEVEEAGAGIEIAGLTKEDVEVKIGGESVSPQNKTLSWAGTANGIYRYNLALSSLNMTGRLEISLPQNAVLDKVSNASSSVSYSKTAFNTIVDNAKPKIEIGEARVVSITNGKNLSGTITPGYINSEYQIEIPITVEETGTDLYTNNLSLANINLMVGGIVVLPEERRLSEATLTEEKDAAKEITTYKYDYTLTYKGITGDGYIKLEIPAEILVDKSGNKSEGILKDITNQGKNMYVDNTLPSVGLKNALTQTNASTKTMLEIPIKITDTGARNCEKSIHKRRC